MKSLIWAASALALGMGSAQGAECYAGSSEAITINRWSVEVVSEATHRIAYDLTSHMAKPVRMVQVETGFYDVLGERIGGFKFEPDFSIAPGETVAYSRDIGALLMPRLPKLDPADVLPYFCTHAVVYADGTKETFE